MTDTDHPQSRDMTKAWEGNRRKRKERLATELREAGWLVVPPEEADTYIEAYQDAHYRQEGR